MKNERRLFSLRNIIVFLFGMAFGMIFSPDSGKANRTRIKQRLDSWRADLRKRETRIIGRTNYEMGRVTGAVHYLGRRLRLIRSEREALDDVVNQRVKTELGENPKTAGIPRLNIDTYEGIVTIRGQVDNEHRARVAENVVRDIEGVREVVNKLHFDVASSGG